MAEPCHLIICCTNHHNLVGIRNDALDTIGDNKDLISCRSNAPFFDCSRGASLGCYGAELL